MRQHQLLDRDLIWLPENAGWIVNLQNVVDAETGAVLPLELPAKLSPGTGGSPATSEWSKPCQPVTEDSC